MNHVLNQTPPHPGPLPRWGRGNFLSHALTQGSRAGNSERGYHWAILLNHLRGSTRATETDTKKREWKNGKAVARSLQTGTTHSPDSSGLARGSDGPFHAEAAVWFGRGEIEPPTGFAE